MDKNIKNLNLEELQQILVSWNQPAFHAKQIFPWIYKKGILDFNQMSDIPLALKKRLAENFRLFDLKIETILASSDGTRKFLFILRDKNFIEAVVIPVEARVTGCISTQVGCKFACRFCASGLSGFKRNLSCAEIIEQVLYLKHNAIDKKLTHLVFMGMGEPLDNYDNLLKAIRIINAEYGVNIGARRITISSCGIVPAIEKLAGEGLQIELSISLHAADDMMRSQIMPINKTYPLKGLILACRRYIEKTNRQVTFEYVLIKNLNSDLQNALKLSKIVQGLNCKINLIPCNYIKELKVEPPDKREIIAFKNALLEKRINVTIRKPRGEDINSACGQLRLGYEKK